MTGPGLTGRARQLREAAGVSQARLARHVGVAQSVLAAWEDGRITCPGLRLPEAARRWLAVLRLLDAPPGYRTLCGRCNSSKRDGPACRLDHSPDARRLCHKNRTGAPRP